MDYMSDSEDTLITNVIVNDSQALEDIPRLRNEVSDLSEQFLILMKALAIMNGNLEDISDNTAKVATTEKETEGATDALAGAFQRAGTALQMAFGLGVYQIVNNTLNLIKGGIKDGLDFAQAMFLIDSAVSQMREAGVDVQFKDLSNIVTDLGPKLQVFSNLDLSKAVGQVAALGGQFGLTAQQVSDLVEFSAVAVERVGGDIVTNATQIQTALLNMTNMQARRIYQMTAVEMNAIDIYNKAVQLGLDNGAKTYTQLSDNSKVIAGTAVLEEHLADLRKNESAYLDVAPGKVKSLGAAWDNLWTGFGIAVTNIMPKLVDLFHDLVGQISAGAAALGTFIDIMTGGFNRTWTGAEIMQDYLSKFNQAYNLYTNPPPTAVTGSPSSPSTTPLGTGGGSNVTDVTGKAVISGLTSTPQQESSVTLAAQAEKEIISIQDDEAAKLAKIETDKVNKITDIETKYNASMEALAVDKADKLQAIETKYARDLEALYVDEANKAQAIQANTNETLLTDSEKYQLDELQAQQKYQEELQSLNDTLNLDLEDALRARDAKTIIRLIEQYDAQKTQKAQQYADAETIRQQNYQQEIDLEKQQEAYQLQQLQVDTQVRAQALATQRTQEIQDLNTDIAQRQAALATERDQEIAAANLAAQRETEAETTDINNRLKAWADGLMTQYNLTSQQVQNIYALLRTYFGPNGYVDQVYGYLIARMGQVAAEAAAVAQAYGNIGFGTPAANVAVTGMASGGSLFANKPTSVTFGEAGPELAMFLPLGTGFKGAPSIAMAGQNGGSIQLQVTLDPNLQAQIVQTSLDNVALSIDRINRQQ